MRDRIVFDWHNFLSGCSTWNLPETGSVDRQSQKMGYNAIMVHAYGNNPMVSFTFNGKTKPVGYLSTTVKGRDWSTMHVNDVRRLWGGEVFNAAGLRRRRGAWCRTTSARQRRRSSCTACSPTRQQRAMDVYFAVDVDTVSANPQELIRTLPRGRALRHPAQAVAWMGQQAGKMWLANPDTPEGYRYYKAQVEALLKAYPQITCLVVWFRHGRTPWMEMKVSEMPPHWQEEYRARDRAERPRPRSSGTLRRSFALGKIIRAFDRGAEGTGRTTACNWLRARGTSISSRRAIGSSRRTSS